MSDRVEHTEPSEGSQRTRVMAITVSFLVGASLMAVKFYAYRLTHSSAILSDALESIINVVASAFALISIVLSAKPPDECHPYGHGKIEFFSAGFEGALIMIAAVGIFTTGISHILTPHPLHRLRGGLWLLLGAGVVNLLLGVFLLKIGRRTRSLTLTADGKHVLTDVYTSAGVLLGLYLVVLTGWYWLDGVIACLVGINIIIVGGRLVRMSFSGLMDASDPVLLKEVAEVVKRHRKDLWIDVHRLRVLRSGNLVNVDFHMILPRYLTLEEAHHESKALEKIIVNHFDGNALVLIHLDPCQAADCPVCGNMACDRRGQAMTDRTPWEPAAMRGFDLDREHHDGS
jgi:cation diffusion facilitator family transporter